MASVTLLLLSLLAMYGTAALAEKNSVDAFPPFCGRYECPKYEVLKIYKTFELRRYESTNWVTTQLDTDMFGLGIMKSFRRLSSYINGQNTEEPPANPSEVEFSPVPLYLFVSGKDSFDQKRNNALSRHTKGTSIKMCVPVRAVVTLLDPSINATLSLFVPPAIVNPPAPMDSSLYLESYSPTSYYVRSFGGYALKSDYEEESKALAEDLVALGLAFDGSFVIAAAYNDPLTFFKRHNEVWFRSLN